MRFVTCILVFAVLVGCSSVREVRLVVRQASTSEPAPGVRVRAISLDTGTVPLPLNEDTLDEILATGSVEESVTTNANGEALLRLRSRVAHIVELVPPPLGPGSPKPGDATRVSRFVLDRGATGIQRSDDTPGSDVFTVEVKR